ncbi:MAG: polyphosphate kinase 2 family protein [Bacteroidia bacterium]|nr:polyphosphate kinase 2 family protein [Bacteroidia bacterium]
MLKDKNIAVKNGKGFKLSKFDTAYKDGYHSEEKIKNDLENYKNKIEKLQNKLFASGSHSLLIVLQAMDAAGKDSLIKHVMSGINPQGCEVTRFEKPSNEEVAHDFLWRAVKALPEKGHIGIFNRSYYEEVLVAKVHPELLLRQKLPDINTEKDANDKFWEHRYASICDMERHLVNNGTVIIKVFLNMSKAEQKNRFMERIEDPEKHWKFSYDDLTERKLWGKYMKAYDTMISKTATDYAPWYIIPADDQWVSRIMVCEILLKALENLDVCYPVVSRDDGELLKKGKAELEAE